MFVDQTHTFRISLDCTKGYIGVKRIFKLEMINFHQAEVSNQTNSAFVIFLCLSLSSYLFIVYDCVLAFRFGPLQNVQKMFT